MEDPNGRNRRFRSSRQPLKENPDLQLDSHRVNGPVSFLNPTRAHFRTNADRTKRGASESQGEAPTGVSYKWNSRNNRKGRHALGVHPDIVTSKYVPPATNSARETLRGIRRMCTQFPVWDISYDVATIFTLGSVIWVINAFFVFLPLVQPDTEFKNEILFGGGITAFIGATVFEVGSILLMAEAINENRTGCFGWALERALSHDREDGQEAMRLRPSKSACTHHHLNKRNLVGKARDSGKSSSGPTTGPKGGSWIWWPSMDDLRTHYIHDLGFLASFAQLIGASIFWISGLTALPGIYDHMSHVITIVFYWTPQVVGGSGFIISGTLFMIETQSRWYKPAFGTLGWWIGVWNLIGGIGFTLCPAFGYDERSWAQYQASLSTFWGSWAFLIGSVIQWYESLDKNPVEVEKST
ncbi:hypothetical protein BDV96DRAFT_614520 [Lophiotrema nucula]|uniref:Integral membrane protein n=1 Tax=Lophiotrema nucula TaxID=690887 RepID=A0A6A5YYG8_9PLEO|nr:hypothetical protein BDV96DRAFT_614520 [Lophiotrema nucula]